MAITHTFVSAKANSTDTTLVRPSNWNAEHTIDASTTFTTPILTSPTINGTIATTGLAVPALTLSGSITGAAQTMTGMGSINGLVITANTGTITTGVWSGTGIVVGKGGTGVATLALNGILYGNDTSAVGVTAIGAEGQILRAGASPFVPAWTTATFPTTTTVNQLLYSSAANVVSGLATGNSMVLVTSAGGVPSFSATLPAVTLGNNMTVTGYAFVAGGGNAQVNTTGSYCGLIVQSTNDGNGGSSLYLKQISTSPAVADRVGTVIASGKDSAGNTDDYCMIRFNIESPTSTAEAGCMEFVNKLAGAWNEGMTLSAAGLGWFDVGVNVDEYYQVAGTQVVGARVVDARCDDAINSGDATTDGVIDALRDAMITHGLIAAS